MEQRIWVCFVCGGKCNNYGDYCNHIISEHEEGRDYIVCPVDCCGSPVRCLKSHFKSKHPKRPMPKNLQMKSTIWRDFANGKKRTRKPTFKEGYFHSGKNGGKDIYFRSGYECDVYRCLEEDIDIKGYTAEPFKVPYYFNNEWHNYIPDLRLDYIDGSVDIWEIKPQTQTELAQNQAKWNAMQNYAERMGWNFTVITETGINRLKHKIRDRRRNQA